MIAEGRTRTRRREAAQVGAVSGPAQRVHGHVVLVSLTVVR